MKSKSTRHGQGATEYLLILAAVLVIVAIAIYYITSTSPSAVITGSAVRVDNNTVSFTPANTMVPQSIASGTPGWSWAVYHNGSSVTGGFTAGTQTLQRGVPMALDLSSGTVAVGDEVLITYQANTYKAAIVG